MSAGGSPRATSIVANLDIETPTGDRLSLRGDGGELTLAAASVSALWRTRRVSRPFLGAAVTPLTMINLPLAVNVTVSDRVVARVEMKMAIGARVRLRWFALLRALF